MRTVDIWTQATVAASAAVGRLDAEVLPIHAGQISTEMDRVPRMFYDTILLLGRESMIEHHGYNPDIHIVLVTVEVKVDTNGAAQPAVFVGLR